MLLWASTRTIIIRTSSRDWLVPPGHGLWVPAATEHSAVTLAPGEISVIRFEPVRCPMTWAEPTGVAVSPLLRELILHLHAGPDGPARLTANQCPASATSEWLTLPPIRAARDRSVPRVWNHG
jgi:hypothetical protein